MKTVGIIVEYNPLHNGHLYHLQQSKKITGADAVVAVMSGNFLQRGEPAIVNKWARAQMALEAGVDLVIELPSTFASQPAEWFAYGAVSALHAAGIVDSLCFGSETGSLDQMQWLAAQLKEENEPFKTALQLQLKRGVPYPKAYSNAAESTYGRLAEIPDISKPNNSLGLHYLIALHRLNSTMTPYTITRSKAGYNQMDINDNHIASATAIRRRIEETGSVRAIANYVPAATLHILEQEIASGRGPVTWEHFAKQIYHLLLTSSPEQLQLICEVNEGLEHRMKKAVYAVRETSSELTVGALLRQLKTKRYTMTKLQRTLLRLLLQDRKPQLNKSELAKGVQYLRVLGFSSTGRLLLKAMRKSAAVPVITNVTKDCAALLSNDLKAAAVHALAYNSAEDLYREFAQTPLTTT